MLSTVVVRTLRKIARDGMPRHWIGFDDAEIYWFLDRYKKKTGRNLGKLRAEHTEACKKAGGDEAVVTFFPFSKTQAKALLREIDV